MPSRKPVKPPRHETIRIAKCIALSPRMKKAWKNATHHLILSKARALARSKDVAIVSYGQGLANNNYLENLKHKKVIYTAIFGNKDNIPAMKIVPADWDLVCFTDNESLDSKTWSVVFCEPSHRDPTRAARELKLSPHKLFPAHECSAWIDGNINLTCDPKDYFDRFLRTNDFVLLRHWQDVKGPFHEVERCVELKKDDAELLRRQGAAYREAGLPAAQEVVWTAVILRRHNKPEVVAFDDMWRDELHKWSKRDQISFPYCAWKAKLQYATIPGLGPYFRRFNHTWGGWK